MAFFGTVPVFLESLKRMEDYTIFTIPRVLEGLFDLLVKLGYVKTIPHSLKVIFAASIALLLVLRKFYPDLIPHSYFTQLGFLFGYSDLHIKKVSEQNKLEKIADK